MLSKTLVRQIEAHSDRLLSDVLSRMKMDNRVCAYWALPESELKEAVGDVFHHLGDWLTSRTDSAIMARYRRIGRERFTQKVPLSQLLCAFVLVKVTLIDFIRGSVAGERDDVELERELLLSIGDFFDKAMCAAAAGYEDAVVAESSLAEPLGSGPVGFSAAQPLENKPNSTEWDPTSRAGEVGEVSG